MNSTASTHPSPPDATRRPSSGRTEVEHAKAPERAGTAARGFVHVAAPDPVHVAPGHVPGSETSRRSGAPRRQNARLRARGRPGLCGVLSGASARHGSANGSPSTPSVYRRHHSAKSTAPRLAAAAVLFQRSIRATAFAIVTRSSSSKRSVAKRRAHRRDEIVLDTIGQEHAVAVLQADDVFEREARVVVDQERGMLAAQAERAVRFEVGRKIRRRRAAGAGWSAMADRSRCARSRRAGSGAAAARRGREGRSRSRSVRAAGTGLPPPAGWGRTGIAAFQRYRMLPAASA